MKKLIFTCLLLTSCLANKTQEEIEQSISRSPVLKRVNTLCIEIPKPNNFRFVKKHIGGNAVIASLVFDYWFDRSHKEVEKFYIIWAKENGWTKLDENEYVKEKQTVLIEFETFSDSNVGISCKEMY